MTTETTEKALNRMIGTGPATRVMYDDDVAALRVSLAAVVKLERIRDIVVAYDPAHGSAANAIAEIRALFEIRSSVDLERARQERGWP